MKAAFLGLGAIGWPMAVHLARRHDLTVWNRTRSRAEAFAAEQRCRAAATPAAAALGAQVVVTCLPTSAEVEALLGGEHGLEAGLAPGALVLDCTSGDPTTSRRIAERLGVRSIAFADAPVSGGTNGAEAGTLTVMVGADDATFARAEPVLRAFGGRIDHLGPVGAGHAMKAVNNALLAVNIRAFAEGFAALVKAGIPARGALDVLNASSGRSFVSESLVPDRVLTGAFPPTFRLALLEKDVGIAVELLDDTGVDGAILRRTRELFREARTTLGEHSDYLEAIRIVERGAGVEIRG